ncbi:protein FAR1-RELATED SEQUENCE 5-like [Andrographis paniculata]|uniref:protein FAR1-RELATED SEQUENCE 5-like n=1 Tax=Andrographis paniculata TaxID=175694 RepID=UPI0021E87A2A|nr:protein FAR1-RELATED SEQUENCE 5-like [Andrographis paniculata]
MEIDEFGMTISSSSHGLDFTNTENKSEYVDVDRTTTMRNPKIGMVFDKEEEAYQYYLAYAKEIGFGIKRHKMHKDKKECVGLTPKASHDLMVKEAGGRDNLGFTRQDHKNYLRTKRTKDIKFGDTGGVLEYLQGMQSKDPNSSYFIQLDEDDMITNIFWADSRMKADYADFGDVVSFDTTYRKNRESRPFALFVGVNHHRQTIIFGASLLYDETIPSFEWLFDTFASTMGGKKPTTILTDQDHAMANALTTRWPETCHRLCIWHIYQNAAIHLGGIFEKYNDFAHDFGRCIYDCEEEDEFLHEWNKMLVKYDILENEWLNKLFRVKEKWALVYGRQFFCADITTTQRSEGINSVIKRYVSSKNPLRVFFERFENFLESRRYEELKADFKASISAPVLHIPVQILKHAAGVYTPEVFKGFQKELWKAYDCAMVLVGTEETIAVYEVSYLGRSKNHIVKLNSSNETVSCSCKKFEFGGLLCAHALKVLTNNNVFKIPEKYVMRRWTKSAKMGRVVLLEQDEDDPKKMASTRFKDLSLFFKKLVIRAAETKEMYELVKESLLKTNEKVNEYLHNKNAMGEESYVRDTQSCLRVRGSLEKEDNIHVKGIKTKARIRSGKRPKSELEKNARKKTQNEVQSSRNYGSFGDM